MANYRNRRCVESLPLWLKLLPAALLLSMTYRMWFCWADWRAWPTPRQGTPRRWSARNGWCRRGARRPPSPSMATLFTAICIGSRLIFKSWLTLTSNSSSSPCLSDGDSAHCPCSHSSHSPTPGSPMAQSHPQQPLRPSNSRSRKWSLSLVVVDVLNWIQWRKETLSNTLLIK